MQKPGVYTTIHQHGGWQKQLSTQQAVAKTAGKGTKFVILSVLDNGSYDTSRWIEGVGRCTYKVLCYAVTYVVLPKTKKSETLQTIVREYAKKQTEDTITLFLPAAKVAGMKESALRECFKNLVK